MALFVEKILRQDRGKKAHSLVFGFIHNKQRLIKPYDDIPDAIIIECLKYYFEYDKWDENGYAKDCMKLEDDIITCIEKSNMSAFCLNVASEGVHEWKFKIVQITDLSWTQSIGIWKVNKKNDAPYNTDFCFKSGESYALKNTGSLRSGDSKEWYCKTGFRTGDIITMTLDMNKGILKFGINDKDYGKAYDVDSECQYRAAISLYTPGDAIQLL